MVAPPPTGYLGLPTKPVGDASLLNKDNDYKVSAPVFCLLVQWPKGP